MPASKSKDSGHHGRTIAIVAGASVLALLLAWWCWPQKPALGNDREVVATTDALFTALTSQNQERLNDCERRLLALRDTGQLPAEAAAYLDKIVNQARVGGWDSAARKLYAFIRVQGRQARARQTTT